MNRYRFLNGVKKEKSTDTIYTIKKYMLADGEFLHGFTAKHYDINDISLISLPSAVTRIWEEILEDKLYRNTFVVRRATSLLSYKKTSVSDVTYSVSVMGGWMHLDNTIPTSTNEDLPLVISNIISTAHERRL